MSALPVTFEETRAFEGVQAERTGAHGTKFALIGPTPGLLTNFFAVFDNNSSATANSALRRVGGKAKIGIFEADLKSGIVRYVDAIKFVPFGRVVTVCQACQNRDLRISRFRFGTQCAYFVEMAM
ncbi:hypothetical protein L596_017050 [Steinernema carpocapsae]|uniref:Uncharacterized protein n=1 Tax=Steinernema carpocapsae TaxID=34508 RepID=A0A4U5N0D0_STECR|nr:hypothetical protein L596_017050 [Steinernema carpocapsae]